MRSKSQINNKSVRRERSEKEVNFFVRGRDETPRIALSVVSDDSSPLSKLMDGQSVQPSDISTIVGNNCSSRDDDSTVHRLRSNIGNKKVVTWKMDDDTIDLSENSYMSDYHSIISDSTPRASNCVTPSCTDFEISDLDQHGIASCVGKEVADTSFDLVDGCVLMQGSLLLDEFFSPKQAKSLQNTFHEVSTEFDAVVDAASTTALSLVQDLTCGGQEIANELFKVAIQTPRKKKKSRTIKQQTAIHEQGRHTTVPIREVRVKPRARRTPSQQVGGRLLLLGRQTPSQVKETAPLKNSPPRGVMLLRKLAGRLRRGRRATKTA